METSLLLKPTINNEQKEWKFIGNLPAVVKFQKTYRGYSLSDIVLKNKRILKGNKNKVKYLLINYEFINNQKF
jgi:hypothetical protein